MTKSKYSDIIDNVIVLRSANGKVGCKYHMLPCKDPNTGLYPPCVRRVKPVGDGEYEMILSVKDTELLSNNEAYFIPENADIVVEDGTVFSLDNIKQAAEWEAIKNCALIAPEREATDNQGNYLIDGTMDWKSKKPRYGIAELYIDKPGVEAQRRVSFKKKVRNAMNFIYDDERGYDGRVLRCKLLGKKMQNQPDADITDFLLQIAEKDPDKIIRLYTGDDIALRMLLIDGKDKKVIIYKNKLYTYGDDVVLGATEEATLTFLKDPKNKKLLELIRKDVYLDYEKKEK